MIPSQRHLFNVPSGVAYFNTAYNAPQLTRAKEMLLAGVAAKDHPWRRAAWSFFEDAETIRGLAAAIFGGDANGYAVVPAASYGISAAARVVEPRLGPGDRILVLDREFPSNVLPWRRTARETGATLVVVPTPKAGSWTEAVVDRVDRNTKVVAVPSCHWTNGGAIDLDAIRRRCRDVESMLVVDASQSLGAVPLSVAELDPDFLVAAGYKWLLCPYGFTLLYVAERWRDARPLEESWLARAGAEDFASLVDCSETYRPGARRFDAGEKCAPTILPGAIAALKQLEAWGVDAIAAALGATTSRIAVHLEELGFEVPAESRRSPHMIGARLPGSVGTNVVDALARQDIYISQRGDTLRFSPHLHVNEPDVDRLLAALADLRGAHQGVPRLLRRSAS
jgi:selenocysteine lyase/cysteine desulfurase